MRDFAPTTKGLSCPICNGADGRCRITDWGVLCMSATSAEIIPAYRFLGPSKDGLWGKWFEVGEEDDYDRAAVERLKQERKQAKLERLEKTLYPEDRHREYSSMLSELTVCDRARADLHRRGLSDEEIEFHGFKSIGSYQPLNVSLNPLLPGVSNDGRSLNNRHPGYLCPVRNVRGNIVGFQLRHHDPSHGRYTWMTNRLGPHLPIGELPLSVCHPMVTQDSDTLLLTEGVGVKPFIAAQRFGAISIGASGGQFATSPQTFLRSLEYLKRGRLRFFPDAGSILNPTTLSQYRASWSMLDESTLSIDLKIGWWNQVYKNGSDVDELEDLSIIEFLTPKQFWNKAKTIAISEYQGVCRALGLKGSIGNDDAIVLLKKAAKLRSEHDILKYRLQIRSLMEKVKISWDSEWAQGWLAEKKVAKDAINVSLAKQLIQDLQTFI